MDIVKTNQQKTQILLHCIPTVYSENNENKTFLRKGLELRKTYKMYSDLHSSSKKIA